MQTHTQSKMRLRSGLFTPIAGALLGVALGAYGAASGGEAVGANASERPCWRANEKVMAIDRIEDEWVVLEVGQGQRVDIPLRVFPEGLAEGQHVSFILVKEDGEARQRALDRLRRLRGEEVEHFGQRARGALSASPQSLDIE